ncbi:MAG: hypothetical protein II557_07510, partial [Clostridia bacterium]|nr:hypothetical protein [Clostridia bacterium]
MKKLLTLALVVMIVAALAISVSANSGTGYTITAARGTPTVDGVKDDIWDTTEAQTQDRIRSGDDTGTHVTIRFLYDDENLYYLGEVPDSSLWTKDLSVPSMTWQMDGSEICLSLSNNSAGSIDTATDAWVGVTPYADFYSSQANWLVGSGAGVSDDGETFDAQFMEIHTSLENDPDNETAKPYYVEVVWHIKAYDEQYAPKEGVTYGFEVSYNDNADYNGRTMCIGWSDVSDSASTNPSVWGEIVLGGSGAAAGAASGDAPTLLWDFNEDEAMSEDMGANSNNAVSFWGEKDDAGNDYYVFVAGGNDPYVSVDLDAEDVSDVVWCKARVKNPGPATAIELFGHTDGRGLNGSECTHINVASDNEWHTYIIYIPDENVKTVNAYKDPQYAITEPYWAGTVDWIRLDPMWQEGNDGSDSGGSMTSGDEIYIDYIAFFPTEEAAQAFRADQDNAGDVAGTPTVSNGTPTYATNYQIPKTEKVPTIDGVKDAGEWDDALIMRVNANSTHVIGATDTAPDATFYYKWNDDGIYLFANVLDSTEPFTIHDPGEGSYNSGDGIQLNIYPDTEITGGVAGMIYFWSLVVNSEGTASVGEHFIYSDGNSGVDVPDVVAACTKDGTNYTIEAFFPVSVWTESDPPLEIKEGTTFGMTNVVMEEDEGLQDLIVDSAWFNADNQVNTYTLAGAAAAEEPAGPTELLGKSWDNIYVDGEMMVNGGADGWLNDNKVEGAISELEVRGWAYISTDLNGFAYAIDGGDAVKSADFIADRPDVKAAIAESANGFDIKIDVSGLGEGAHSIKIYAVDTKDELVDTGFELPFTLTAAESKGFASAEEAAAGKNIITGYEFVSGTNGFGGEGAENLWDGDTGTKFCTNEFPVESIAKL